MSGGGGVAGFEDCVPHSDRHRSPLAGHPSTLEELVTRHAANVYFLILGMTGDPDEASDLAQDTWVRALRGLPAFRGLPG